MNKRKVGRPGGKATGRAENRGYFPGPGPRPGGWKPGPGKEETNMNKWSEWIMKKLTALCLTVLILAASVSPGVSAASRRT